MDKVTKTVTVYRGLNKTAKKLGCSRTHLSYVMHGQRKPGAELAKKLKKLGVIIPDVVAE